MTKQDFIKQQVSKGLRSKLALERPFMREVQRYFNQQAKKLRRNDVDIDTIRPVYERQYKRVIKNITGIRLKSINVFTKQETIDIENVILNFLTTHSLRQASLADKTTLENVEKAIENARVQLAEEGNVRPANKILMIVASRIFKRLNRGRIGNITVTETQASFEKTKSTVVDAAHKELGTAIVDSDEERANELFKVSQDWTTKKVAEGIAKKKPPGQLFALIAQAEKVWRTVGDRKVRGSHRKSNWQERPINDPFLVGSSLLMFPGDTSLGADMSEIYGCRCVSVYL